MYRIIMALIGFVLMCDTVLSYSDKDKIGLSIHIITIISYILLILKYLEGGL